MDNDQSDYWYVGYSNAPWDFFRDEHKITEEEWRNGAPADRVAMPDAQRTVDRLAEEIERDPLSSR